MDARQQTLNFTRGTQLRLIDDAVFARSYRAERGSSVSGVVLKGVLRVIDGFARQGGTCFASIALIAQRASCSERVAERAIAVLRDVLAIVEEEEELDSDGRRRPRRVFHRWIVWSNLESLSDFADPQPPKRETPPATMAVASRHESRPHPPRVETCPLQEAQKEPPPPTPKPAGPKSDEAAAVLVSIGIEWPTAALAAARATISEGTILELIDYFRTQGPPNGWGPGALVRRLQNARPDLPVDRGWPARSVSAQIAAQNAQEAARRAAEAEDAEKARNASAAELERLERSFGRELDAMPADALEALARRTLEPLELKRFRRHGIGRVLRRRLLAALEGDPNRCR